MAGQFGFAPFIVGTVWVTLTTMIIAVPICVLCAMYLSEYAGPRLRGVMKPLLDILAAIPSVIYGVWGLLAIVPLVQAVIAPALEQGLGFIPLFQSNNPTGFSVLAASLVLAIMVTPVIIAVTYEVLQTVPQGLREASLAMGATRWQTIKYVVLPKALAGRHRGDRAGLFARVRRDDRGADGGGQCAADAALDLRCGLSAARADRQQLRRDDVDSAVRCGADGRGVDLAGGGAGASTWWRCWRCGRPCGGQREEEELARRHVEEAIFKALMIGSFLLVAGGLVFILITIMVKGLPALTWEMLTQTPKGGFYLGKEGGILNAIVGIVVSGGRRDDSGVDREHADRVVSDDLRPPIALGAARCGSRST